MTEEVLLGTAFVTDRGDWTAGTAYEENDIVHTPDGVFMSLVDDNISTVDDTEKWRTWVDLTAVNTATSKADTAADNATKAASDAVAEVTQKTDAAISDMTSKTATAISNSEAQTEIAKSYNEHPPKIGDNGNWWTWDGTQYVDTSIPSRGDALYPSLIHEGNKLYITNEGSVISEYVKKDGNKLVFDVYN